MLTYVKIGKRQPAKKGDDNKMTLKELFEIFDTEENNRYEEILEIKLLDGMTYSQAVMLADVETGKA